MALQRTILVILLQSRQITGWFSHFFGILNIIDLNTYRFNKTKPGIAFNSVKVLDKEYINLLEGDVPLLSLNHNQNYLQFEPYP